MIEYQENFNKWAGGRIGLSSKYMHYELSSLEFNNRPLNLSTAPYDMLEHSAVSLDYYFAFFVYL